MKKLNLITGQQKKISPMKWIRTPKEIWKPLSKEFNFTVDACASHNNHLLDKYWTKEVVYCHPMYDNNIPKFIKKGIQSNSLCVFLLPASTNAKYFHDYLWCNIEHKPKENIQIRFLQKPDRNGFYFANDLGELPKTGYLRPLMLVIMQTTN